jgi:hypothetical protein
MANRSYADRLCLASNARITGRLRPVPYATQLQPDLINARGAEAEAQIRKDAPHLEDQEVERQVLVTLSLQFGEAA